MRWFISEDTCLVLDVFRRLGDHLEHCPVLADVRPLKRLVHAAVVVDPRLSALHVGIADEGLLDLGVGDDHDALDSVRGRPGGR